jgi:catechol 2,3-dioxygenase-like lactoylglutathione lyase family enzyme
MTWAIHGVSLFSHDFAAAEGFFAAALGLGPAHAVDAHTIAFGHGDDRLRLHRPRRHLARIGTELVAPAGARHVAIDVDDLHRVVTRLDRAAIPHIEADDTSSDAPAVCTLDPALNIVVFRQRIGPAPRPIGQGGWFIHHVNLEVQDVREAVGFYTEVAGMTEGRWRAPAERGDFSTDPALLAVLPAGSDGHGGDNSGLHIIRADPGFALRNNFAHNPSIGGHPAFCVPDVLAVKARLQAAGVLVSDAGVYAMAGMHQIYAFDPSGNMIEVNQVV